MDVSGICLHIYGLVAEIGALSQRDSAISEDCQRLHANVKHVQKLVTGVHSFAPSLLPIWTSLKEIECILSELVTKLKLALSKGPLITYLLVDSVLEAFDYSAERMGSALSNLESSGVAMPRELQIELHQAKERFGALTFRSQSRDVENVARYKQACDTVSEGFQEMLGACREMLIRVFGADSLSKEEFVTTILSLQEEVEALAERSHAHGGRIYSGGGSGTALGPHDEVRLRAMLDMLRVHHVKADTPIEYLCPLTHQLMYEPVIMVETGNSYEKKAIEEWWAKGHHFCPRSGMPLKRLNLVPNNNLKLAIDRWRLNNDMQLTFRPLLATLYDQHEQGRLPLRKHRHTDVHLDRAASSRSSMSYAASDASGSQPVDTSLPHLSAPPVGGAQPPSWEPAWAVRTPTVSEVAGMGDAAPS